METGEGHVRGGVLVVVWGRESRSRGEGGQEADRFLKPEESVDTDARTDKVWLLNVQRKLYQWSRGRTPKDSKCAGRTVAPNEGKRTPGIDGGTIEEIHRH